PDLKITTRDRLLRAWQNSTEPVRDFENYARETSDHPEAASLFAQYAVEEGRHAENLLRLLRGEQ
ncbi:MAG: rubrerythrin, partial [Clostridia bacterium]|nr:rubrerythrin [Clostridia bacterium]